MLYFWITEKTCSKIKSSNIIISVITLSINGLNAGLKGRDSHFDQDTTMVCLQQTHLNIKTQIDEKQTNGKRYSLKLNKKKTGVATLLSDEVHSRTKIILQDKDSHFIKSKE